MSVEYRPRFVCCRADREKGVSECTQHPPHDSHSVRCRHRRPPAARRTTPPPFSPADHTTEPLAPPKTSAEEVYDIPKDSVHRCSSLFMDYYLWTILPGLFLVAVSPSQGQLQVGCWPHTSFGSNRKKEEVSISLFVDFTNKFKASIFPTLRPPEGYLRVNFYLT